MNDEAPLHEEKPLENSPDFGIRGGHVSKDCSRVRDLQPGTTGRCLEFPADDKVLADDGFSPEGDAIAYDQNAWIVIFGSCLQLPVRRAREANTPGSSMLSKTRQ